MVPVKRTDHSLCTKASQEARNRHSKLDIFNTDQDNRFTSQKFTQLLKEKGIANPAR